MAAWGAQMGEWGFSIVAGQASAGFGDRVVLAVNHPLAGV